MKKKDVIIFIVLLLISIVSFVYCIYMVFIPNYNDENLSYSDLSNSLKEYNCVLNNIEEDYLKSYYKTDDNCIFEINYIEFSNRKNINDYYYNYLDKVLDNENTRIKSNINIENYYLEKNTTGDYYKSLIIKKNTLFYLSSLNENKSKAIDLKKSINYYYEPNWNKVYYLIVPIITFITSLIYVINKSKNSKSYKKI